MYIIYIYMYVFIYMYTNIYSCLYIYIQQACSFHPIKHDQLLVQIQALVGRKTFFFLFLSFVLKRNASFIGCRCTCSG